MLGFRLMASDKSPTVFNTVVADIAVSWLAMRITSIDPDHILLAYPIGRFNDAVNYNYQKWMDWIDGGHIDGIFPKEKSFQNRTKVRSR